MTFVVDLRITGHQLRVVVSTVLAALEAADSTMARLGRQFLQFTRWWSQALTQQWLIENDWCPPQMPETHVFTPAAPSQSWAAGLGTTRVSVFQRQTSTAMCHDFCIIRVLPVTTTMSHSLFSVRRWYLTPTTQTS